MHWTIDPGTGSGRRHNCFSSKAEEMTGRDITQRTDVYNEGYPRKRR